MSVTVVATFLWVAMVIALAVGTALLVPGTQLDRMWDFNKPAYLAFQAFGRTAGVGFLVLALIVGSTAAGLGFGRRWAWWLALAIFALNGIGDVFGLLKTRDLARSGSGIVIAAAFVVVLLSEKVRRFFTQQKDQSM